MAAAILDKIGIKDPLKSTHPFKFRQVVHI